MRRQDAAISGVFMKRFAVGLLVVMLPMMAFAADTAPASAPLSAIKEVTGLSVNDAGFKASGSNKPIVIKSEKEAGDYFAAADLAKLTGQVDFKNQVVVVFAWQGSGQDKMEYAVMESYPEQIKFAYTPGRTRDLRPHVNIYVLRSNVTWSMK